MTAPGALRTNLLPSDENAVVGHAAIHDSIASYVNAMRDRIFNVVDFGALANGVTDDTIAIQAAYTALVNVGGGTLFFPPGVYAANNAGSQYVIAIARDNTQVRRKTTILLDAGATVKLSANTPRFIDFAKQSDHDWFGNLRIEGGTIDANNVGGQHHVLIGTYQAGTAQSRINIDRVTIANVRVVNVLNDSNVGTNHRLIVWLAVRHPASNEVTQDSITNVTLRDLDLQGGNAGVGINGQVDAGSQANVLVDNILIDNCRHDTGATPVITAPYASSNFHVGSQGIVGRATVRKCYGARAGDTGIEVNGGRHVTVEDCSVDDSAGPSFYVANYYGQANARHTIRNCEARWTGAWEIGGVSGLNHAGFATLDTHYGNLTIENCIYRSSGGSYTHNSPGTLSGLAATLSAARLSLDLQCLVDTYTADNAGFANPFLVSIHTTAGVSAVDIRRLVMRWTGTHPGAGTWTPRYLNIGGTDVTLHCSGRLTFYEDWGASVGGGNIRAVQLCNYSGDIIRGTLANLRIERLSDDTSPDIVRMLDGATSSVGGRFMIRDCDFAAATAGTEVVVSIAGEKPKIILLNNLMRVDPPAVLTITPSGSPYNYRNLDMVRETVTVQGGTVTVIEFSRDNATFITTGLTAGAFVVDPGDYLRVTYSVAPTMRAFRAR